MEFDHLLTDASGRNEYAESFLRCIVSVAHTWDDLIDRDKPVSDEDINACMWLALVSLPANPFYMQHMRELQPVLVNAMLNWQIATRMERAGGPFDVSYILRSSFVDLIVHVALITQGPQRAVEVGRKVREAAHHEGMDRYIKALSVEAQERGD